MTPKDAPATGQDQEPSPALVRDQHLTVRLNGKPPTVPEFSTAQDWRDYGKLLAKADHLLPWFWGDWWLALKKLARELTEDRAVQFVSSAHWKGPDLKTLRNYASIAKAFPPSRRRERLSLKHHAEVVRLSPDDQDHFLTLAEKHKWSTEQLRRASRPNPTPTEELLGSPLSIPVQELAARPPASPQPPPAGPWSQPLATPRGPRITDAVVVEEAEPTPAPSEAAKLLDMPVAEIQAMSDDQRAVLAVELVDGDKPPDRDPVEAGVNAWLARSAADQERALERIWELSEAPEAA